jgi:ethanolamine permease
MKANRFTLLVLGIMIVNSGPTFSWNTGLHAGFGSVVLSVAMMGSAYFCQCLNTAELSSAIPFAGGSYGLARCTLGYYAGFLTGCFEVFSMILAVSFGSVFLTLAIDELWPGYESLSWVFILMFFVFCGLANCAGKRVVWTISVVMAAYSLLVVLLYIFTWAPKVDITRFANISNMETAFVGGASNFMTYLPMAILLFIGDEVLNLCCDEVAEPRKEVPWAQMTVISIILIETIPVVLITCSAPPGIEATADLVSPVAFGMSHVLFFECFGVVQGYFETGISSNLNMSFQAACLITIFPMVTASIIGFTFAFGKLICAMADSRLFPPILGWRSADGQPIIGCLAGLSLACALALICYYEKKSVYVLQNMFLLCEFTFWIVQSVGFAVLRLRMTDLEREFRSPLGLAGAAYAVAVFLLGIVSILGFQDGNSGPIIGFIVYAAACSLYYWLYAAARQRFSEDEKSLLFGAHIRISQYCCTIIIDASAESNVLVHV